MMNLEIKTLENTSIEEIVDALVVSFQNYFVPIVADYEMWNLRFKTARLNKNLSVGVFDNNKLVAFVLNCIDTESDTKTAFNTGTGVIEQYRNQKLVDKMYDFITPKLKENSIKKLKLEVITENERAIKVYERIGFEIVKGRNLFSFAGNLENISNENVIVKSLSTEELTNLEREQPYYSWDFRDIALKLNENLKVYEVSQDNLYKGYFIINSANNVIAQIEAKNDDWNLIFDGVKQISKDVRLVNVDGNRTSLIDYLKNIGFKNTINQYEMEKYL